MDHFGVSDEFQVPMSSDETAMQEFIFKIYQQELDQEALTTRPSTALVPSPVDGELPAPESPAQGCDTEATNDRYARAEIDCRDPWSFAYLDQLPRHDRSRPYVESGTISLFEETDEARIEPKMVVGVYYLLCIRGFNWMQVYYLFGADVFRPGDNISTFAQRWTHRFDNMGLSVNRTHREQSNVHAPPVEGGAAPAYSLENTKATSTSAVEFEREIIQNMSQLAHVDFEDLADSFDPENAAFERDVETDIVQKISGLAGIHSGELADAFKPESIPFEEEAAGFDILKPETWG